MSSEVPESWRPTTLAAACEFFTDGDWVETKDQNPDGEVRLIQLADIGDGAFLDKSSRFLTVQKARDLRCSLLEPGDLLIARMADPIARCCLFPGLDRPAATVVDVAIARARNGVDQQFLSYAVSDRSFRELALGAASGTTRSRVSRSNLGALPILLPPLDEQRRIAEVLRSVDAAIATNEEQRKQSDAVLSVYRRTVLSHLVVDPVGDTKFGDVCALGRGFAFKSDDYVEEGILNFRVTNVGRHPSRMGEVKFLPFDFAEKFSDYLLEGDEIVLVMVGATVGKLGRVPSDSCPALLNQNMWTLVGKGGVSKELLWHLSHVLIAEKIASIQGGAYSFLTKKDFLNHRIGDIGDPALPIHAEAMSTIERHSSSLRAEAAMLTTIKHHLMDDLLSGRVRVPA